MDFGFDLLEVEADGLGVEEVDEALGTDVAGVSEAAKLGFCLCSLSATLLYS